MPVLYLNTLLFQLECEIKLNVNIASGIYFAIPLADSCAQLKWAVLVIIRDSIPLLNCCNSYLYFRSSSNGIVVFISFLKMKLCKKCTEIRLIYRWQRFQTSRLLDKFLCLQKVKFPAVCRNSKGRTKLPGSVSNIPKFSSKQTSRDVIIILSKLKLKENKHRFLTLVFPG